MVVLDKSVVVAVAPALAWRVVTAFPDAPRWCPGMVSARAVTPGPLRRGSRWTCEREDMGLRLETEQEVMTAVPHERLVTRQVRGDFLAHETLIELTPVPPATRVRVRHRVELPFVLPRVVREADVHEYYSRAFDAALLNLKDHVEGRRVAPAMGAFMATGPAHGVHDGEAGGAVHAH